MNKIQLLVTVAWTAMFSFAVAFTSSAATPTQAILAANRPCSAVKTVQRIVVTNQLDTVSTNADKSVWYRARKQAEVDIGERYSFTAAVTGYTTEWRSYESGKGPKTAFEMGTNLATRTIATTETVDLGTKVTTSKALIDTLATDYLDRTLLYAVFTPIAYSLAYDLDYGSWPTKFTPPYTATYDTAFTLGNPSRIGYSFSGWDVGGVSYPVESEDAMTFSNLTTVADAKVSFTAQWARNSYDLRLVFADGVGKIWYRVQDEGGDWSEWQSVSKTATVQVPYGLKWRAYCETTQHWQYTGSGSSEDNYVEGTMGTDGAKFNPSPSRRYYSLVVRSNPSAGGSARPTAGVYSYESESFVELEATAQTGYRFARWSDGATQTPHTFQILSNTTVTATFEKQRYDVEFKYQTTNGTWITEKQSVAYEESASEPGADKRNIREGYVFDSWDNPAYTKVTAGMQVNADYKANTYEINFCGNGATSGTMENQVLTYDESANLTANTFARTGYTFAGWSTRSASASDAAPAVTYTDQQLVKNIVTNSLGQARDTGATLVLYAEWQPIAYTIAFEANGGSGTMESEAGIKYDEAFTLPACTLAGPEAAAFVCWICSADGKAYTNCETVFRLASEAGATVTMTAQWGTSRTVTFKDGNDEKTGPSYRQSFTANQEFALLPNTFIRTGYTFAGWSTRSASATDAALSPTYADQALVTTSSNLTLTAVWSPNTYQVTFDANNGETSGLTVVSNFTYNATQTPTNALGFTGPSGLTFVGWGTNETAAVYKPTVPKMNLTPESEDHIKLYAIWGLEDCGEYSRALGCENLMWEPQNSGFWMPSDAGLSFTKETFDPLSSSKNSKFCAGTYVLTYEWMPSNTTSQLEIRWNGKAVGSVTNVPPCVWVKDQIQIVVTGVEGKKMLEIEPTNPCQLRNVRWTRVPTTTYQVSFELGAGKRTQVGDCVYGGETNQVIEADHVALEPTVEPPTGMVLAGWVREEKVGGESRSTVDVLPHCVAGYPITTDTAFTAVYTQAVYKVIYADARTDQGYVNRNPPTFTKDTETFGLAPIQTGAGGTAPGFLGWVPGRGQGPATTVTIPKGTTSNVVVTALWEEETTPTHTLTFKSGDGSSVVPVTVEEGKNAELPTPAEKPGYAFVGWDGVVDGVTNDGIVTAKYELISYPIDYLNTRGYVNGQTALKLPLSYTIEDTPLEIEGITPESGDTNYVFLGWSPDGGVTLATGLAKGTTGAQEFTAVWQFCGPQTITINGKTETVAYGTEITKSTFLSVTNGFTNVVCTGWVGSGSVPASGTGHTVTFTVTGPGTLDWQYQTNYWVSAEAAVDAIVPIASSDGGTVALSDASGTLASTEGWFAAGTNLVAEAKPNVGWLFARWEAGAPEAGAQREETGAPEAGAQRDVEAGASRRFSVTAPIALTAVFTQKICAVTFRLGEHLTRTGGGALVQTVTYGESATPPTVKVTTGYTFEGWAYVDAASGKVVTNDAATVARYAITADTTFTGCVAVIPRTKFDVTVSVAEGCEKMGTVSGAKTSVKPGTKVTVKATAKSGYVFAGWYPVDADVSSASGAIETIASTCVSQSASYSFTMPADDVDLEARFLAKGDDWATVSVGEVAGEYAKGVAIDPIAVTAAGGSAPTVKVTGLPTGLKFTAKLVTTTKTETIGGKRVTTLVTNALPNTIYGTPTKSGVYAATVTATTVGKATASTNLTFVVVDRAKGEQVVSTTVALVDADVSSASDAIETIASTAVPGKTTGQGVYAAGKKVTLRATANRGYVFSGWFVDADVSSASPVSRLASYALTVPENDVAYTAAFVSTDDDAASISASVNGMALVVPDAIETIASTGLTVETNVSVGVYLEWPVVADALSATTVAVSGLPSGLKFTAKPVTSRKTTYDEKGKKVYVTVTNVPAMTIYGTPTAASKTDRYGDVVPSTVRVTVTTAGKNKAIGIIALAVEALPTALVGTYAGGSTNEPAGSATVTLAKTGKISGKWVSEGLTWNLTATGFDLVDAETGAPEGRRTTEGSVFVATNVTAKSGQLVETLTLVFSVNDLGYGTVDAIVPIASDASETSASTLFSATYVPWKTDADLKELAKDLKGETFTVDAIVPIASNADETSASTGAGASLLVTLSGKVGANGVVSVKGTFTDADETSASTRPYTATVSSTLVPLDAVDADVSSASPENPLRFSLFLYYPPKANKFDGYTTKLTLAWDGEDLTVLSSK